MIFLNIFFWRPTTRRLATPKGRLVRESDPQHGLNSEYVHEYCPSLNFNNKPRIYGCRVLGKCFGMGSPTLFFYPNRLTSLKFKIDTRRKPFLKGDTDKDGCHTPF